MKKSCILIILSSLVFLKCADTKKQFVLNGTLLDAPEKLNIYLRNDHTGILEDSTQITNKSFQFEGTTPHPQRYSILYKTDTISLMHYIWIENTQLEIYGTLKDFNTIKIKAGKEQQIAEQMKTKSAFFEPEYKRLVNEQKYDSIGALIERLHQSNLSFCINHLNSYFSVETLYKLRKKISKDSLNKLLSHMKDDLRHSNYAKSLELHSKSPDLEVGMYFLDFDAITLSGKKLTISELLNEEKPIMLIFGGLGCMGNRGRKALGKFYNLYKHEIHILPFIFARNREEWNKDSEYASGIQVFSDMKGDHSPVKIKYHVQTTPTVYIIDRKGVIRWISEGYGEIVNDAAIKLIENKAIHQNEHVD